MTQFRSGTTLERVHLYLRHMFQKFTGFFFSNFFFNIIIDGALSYGIDMLSIIGSVPQPKRRRRSNNFRRAGFAI